MEKENIIINMEGLKELLENQQDNRIKLKKYKILLL